MNSQHYRIFGRQGGTALVEFAIILPLLVILLFGFVELGRALYQENMLTKAVTTGARFISRVPEAVTDTCQPGTVWNTATTQAGALIAYADAGTGSVRLPGLDDPGAVTFSTRDDAVGGQPVCVIRVEAAAQFAAIFGDSVVPFLDLGPITLTASAEERYIGE